MERPVRKKPSEKSILSQANRKDILFVTVCSSNKQPVLANEHVVKIITSSWVEADHWQVGRYVVMPDHVHFFCAPNTVDPNLKNWVSYWKRLVSQQLTTDGNGVWQSGFWDTQMRTGKMYEEKWEYVRHNPVRRGLVSVPDDWEYSGDLTSLHWSAS